ncbi:hypothetical protein AOQ84DRAFT_283276, partial [Glonium stellatum]
RLYFANAGINIVTDCTILILPMPFIKKLQIPKRQKITLMVILSIGTFTRLTSMLRLHALYVLSKSKDPTWDQPATAYWSAIGLNTAIICACVPVLRPLVSRISPHFLSANRTQRADYDSGSGNNNLQKGHSNRLPNF